MFLRGISGIDSADHQLATSTLLCSNIRFGWTPPGDECRMVSTFLKLFHVETIKNESHSHHKETLEFRRHLSKLSKICDPIISNPGRNILFLAKDRNLVKMRVFYDPQYSREYHSLIRFHFIIQRQLIFPKRNVTIFHSTILSIFQNTLEHDTEFPRLDHMPTIKGAVQEWRHAVTTHHY